MFSAPMPNSICERASRAELRARASSDDATSHEASTAAYHAQATSCSRERSAVEYPASAWSRPSEAERRESHELPPGESSSWEKEMPAE